MKPGLKATLLVAGLLLGGCAQTLHLERALTAVPYQLQENGLIVIDVRINDQGPFRFALDTAASISFIFDEVRRELGLETVPGTSATVRSVVASGEFPVVSIDRLQVGSEIWSGPEILTLPGDTVTASNIAGILGIDFLRRYGVGFSARDGVVRLFLPDLVGNSSYRGWSSVPLEPFRVGETSEPLYFFEIEIGGRAVPALFDLGAGLNMINLAGARHLRLAPVGAEQDFLISDALGGASVLARLESDEVTTADIRWRNEEFLIADLEIFSTLMHADRPLAILGSGLFNQRDFVIDFVRNRLLVRVAMDEIDEPT